MSIFREWCLWVMVREGLRGWRLDYEEGNTTDGLTLFEHKMISLRGKPDHATMLHELAHAVLERPGHDSQFADALTRLTREYTEPRYALLFQNPTTKQLKPPVPLRTSQRIHAQDKPKPHNKSTGHA